MLKSCTSAPWKKERYDCSRLAMNGFPRSGSPIRHNTCRTPSVPDVAAIGGGTAVGSGLSDVALRRCACEEMIGSEGMVPAIRLLTPRVDPVGDSAGRKVDSPLGWVASQVDTTKHRGRAGQDLRRTLFCKTKQLKPTVIAAPHVDHLQPDPITARHSSLTCDLRTIAAPDNRNAATAT
jgi:hypothetical protein